MPILDCSHDLTTSNIFRWVLRRRFSEIILARPRFFSFSNVCVLDIFRNEKRTCLLLSSVNNCQAYDFFHNVLKYLNQYIYMLKYIASVSYFCTTVSINIRGDCLIQYVNTHSLKQ